MVAEKLVAEALAFEAPRTNPTNIDKGQARRMICADWQFQPFVESLIGHRDLADFGSMLAERIIRRLRGPVSSRVDSRRRADMAIRRYRI